MVQVLDGVIGGHQIGRLDGIVAVRLGNHGAVSDAKHAVAGCFNIERKRLTGFGLFRHDKFMSPLVLYEYL